MEKRTPKSGIPTSSSSRLGQDIGNKDLLRDVLSLAQISALPSAGQGWSSGRAAAPDGAKEQQAEGLQVAHGCNLSSRPPVMS